jgi:hypothetical protein
MGWPNLPANGLFGGKLIRGEVSAPIVAGDDGPKAVALGIRLADGRVEAAKTPVILSHCIVQLVIVEKAAARTGGT